MVTVHGNETGLAPDRREGLLGSRSSRAGVVGDPPTLGGQLGAGGRAALSGAPGRAGPIALVRKSCQRLARRAERTGTRSARGIRVPKIRLEVAVLPGTDERTLDRSVGHIEGTAQPGTDGNAGIAGHRDGFFRGLKDLVTGDLIELDTVQGTEAYRVERTWVVSPEDVSVLDPTSTRALTLVTCYPFYFVGSAPERFILRAVRVERQTNTLADLH